MILVLMGVSGCGKTTVGKLLAAKLGITFLDADDFHPEENIVKMRSGVALTDADRWPWMEKISEKLKEAEIGTGCVLACSALKGSYRMYLQKGLKETIVWVHLEGSREVILERMMLRKTHFMPVQLLQSQFEILEIPPDAHSVSILMHPEEIVEEIIKKITSR